MPGLLRGIPAPERKRKRRVHDSAGRVGSAATRWRSSAAYGRKAGSVGIGALDLVKILNDAIERLPEGDHSPGLLAIMRHISIAIRHFERRGEQDSDSFTDAIYRANQAFEGSLKEAFRVLAAKDPAGKSTNEIEKYLESKAIVRPRVLIQLARYRQDYRNPSTHDHKLDFNEDEALLAIVSVCAFAKLLIDQISEQLAFNAAASVPPTKSEAATDLGDKETFLSVVTSTALDYTNSVTPGLNYSEFEGGLAGRLTAIGFTTDREKPIESMAGARWDIFVSFADFGFAIETRIVGYEFQKDQALGVLVVTSNVIEEDHIGGLAVLFNREATSYNLYGADLEGHSIYIISHYEVDQLELTDRRLKGKLKKLN